MRRLMWFTLGFLAACALCAYLWLPLAACMVAAAVCTVLSLLCLFLFQKTNALKIAGIVCAGCAAAFLWFSAYSAGNLRNAVSLDGDIADVTVQCTDYGYQTDYGTAVEGVLYLADRPYRVKLYLKGETALMPGDCVSGSFCFRITTPGGEKAPTAHKAEGIFLLAYQSGEITTERPEKILFFTYPAMWRRKLVTILDEAFPDNTAFLARALLLGDRSGIDYETNTAFKVSGISHIIAVSGLHVSILFSLVYVLCWKRRGLVALFGIPMLILFAAVAGFTPSVTRAAIMTALMILAMLFDREYDGPTELAFASLVMLLFNPLVVTSVSFQLSVGCMAGIFLFQKRIYDYLLGRPRHCKKKMLPKLRRFFASSVSVTLSAMVPTTPLVAYYFGAVSLVGVLTNLFVLWMVSFIFYGVILVCLLGAFWPGAAAAAAWVVSWPIRYVLLAARTIARFPFAAVYTKSEYIVMWLAFCYILLAVFLLSRKKRPIVLACCAATGLCLALAASWAEPLIWGTHMTVLDVGQGQSILLQSEGKTFLIDCGGSGDAQSADLAAETLLSRGISRLDCVILTHFDRDHAGGLTNLLTRVTVDTLIIPETPEILPYPTVQTVTVREDETLTFGGAELTVFGPALLDGSNEDGLAILFRHENCDILILGDRGFFGEQMLMRATALPKLDVLIAGHHGSKYSTGDALLEATEPQIVIISVGPNSYGHPAAETLERLRNFGCTVYRTDEAGTIVFRR